MFLAEYNKQCTLVAVVALLIAPIIGFSHAAIPHAHTHASDNALHAAIEHGLDNSLSRKDLGTAILVPFFAFFAVLIAGTYTVIPLLVVRVTPYTDLLRRGIPKYRAFR